MAIRFCFTFDVEEWFQVENLRAAFPVDTWDRAEQRVEVPTRRILDLLDRYQVRATFFVLGWVAGRMPALVREIAARGHEIASHGYSHRMCHEMDREQLFEDVRRSKELLEEISGRPVSGFRAPCFSVTAGLMEVLGELDFRYDSSLNPLAYHDRYSSLEQESAGEGPFLHSAGVYELPLPVLQLGRLQVPVSGGGYFRLFPFFIYERLVKRYLACHDLFVFYLHPWEIDPAQPRVRNISRQYRFRHYTGLSRTFSRLEALMQRYGDCAATLESLVADLGNNS